MFKKFSLVILVIASITICDFSATSVWFTGNTCMAAAPNDGTYLKTSSSVSVFNENGHPKGTFSVYLHNGKRYIDFYNTWICIQGKRRFAFRGNWYVIR